MIDESEFIDEVDESVDQYYVNSPPKKWTFSPPKIRNIVEAHLEGRVLNLFAGQTKLNHDGEIVRNDIDEDIDADMHVNAKQIREHLDDNSFDTVILDPPYNIRKGREKYGGKFAGRMTHVKEQVKDLLKMDGIVLYFGYDTTGMSKSRGFEKERVFVINHKGDHNDTLLTIEQKVKDVSTGFYD